jgi:hypothetical protein
VVVAFGRRLRRLLYGGALASAATAAATSRALPNPQETILVGEPTTTDWGTIWSPQFGKGGRI